MKKIMTMTIYIVLAISLAGCGEKVVGNGTSVAGGTDTQSNSEAADTEKTELATTMDDENENYDMIPGSEMMIDPVAAVSIQNIFNGESASITENEDIRFISDILCSDAWNTEGTTDCASNLEITINGHAYKYHSDCGRM